MTFFELTPSEIEMNDRKNWMTWTALIGFGYLSVFSVSAVADEVPPQPPAQVVVLPPGVTEEMLAPPPVPRFMLENAAPKSSQTVPQEALSKAHKISAPPEVGGNGPEHKKQVDAQ